ncbi:hypothetical protein BDZ89DRAFT_393124 [Hymenopellis radicata]|nr:hypothetical protein BDZ89DRAFT_393124 [Hymenopellis radicata]
MTLQDAARAHFQSSIGLYLSNMLSDTSLLPLTRCHILVAAGKFALCHVARNGYLEGLVHARSGNQDWRHLELLDLALHNLANRVLVRTTYNDMNPDAIVDSRMVNEDELGPDDLSAIYEFLVQVITRTNICDYAPSEDFCAEVHGKLIVRCLASLLGMYSWFARRDETFSFPTLRRIIQGSVHQLNYSPSNTTPWRNFYLHDRTFEVMEIALARGVEEAYSLFVEMEWMRLLSEVWATTRQSQPKALPLWGYIRGLSSIRSQSAWQKFLEHLHEPRNMMIAFLMTATSYFNASRHVSPEDVGLQISRLVDLWPTHSSWVECSATAHTLLAWIQCSDRQMANFPLASFFDGKIVHHGSTLEDELQERFVESRPPHDEPGILERLQKSVRIFDNNFRESERIQKMMIAHKIERHAN